MEELLIFLSGCFLRLGCFFWLEVESGWKSVCLREGVYCEQWRDQGAVVEERGVLVWLILEVSWRSC